MTNEEFNQVIAKIDNRLEDILKLPRETEREHLIIARETIIALKNGLTEINKHMVAKEKEVREITFEELGIKEFYFAQNKYGQAYISKKPFNEDRLAAGKIDCSSPMYVGRDVVEEIGINSKRIIKVKK